LFLIAVPIVNNNIARNTAKELSTIPLPDKTEYVERVSLAGKLVGNGNGMQYFGAILIKSELTLEELKTYYSNFANNEWECIVENQTDNRIQVIEHGKLEFQSEINSNEYFIVYSWGNNNSVFDNFDLRGH
jgi:hypothetical protein